MPPNEAGAPAPLDPFSDPAAVAGYADRPPRFVPGFAVLQRMVGIVLAERAPLDARVLIVGAGGGLETRALAEAYAGWSFVGVDPAPEMLKLAGRTLGPLAPRAVLRAGYVDDVPERDFDAATCLLTFHFLKREERLHTLREIHRRLKPGAPLAVAHASFPQDPAARTLWFSRYAAFAAASGIDPAQARAARGAVEAKLSVLAPEEDEALLREAGFREITAFYHAFTWRAWVAYA